MNKPSILLGPIVGGLSHKSANIWARASGPSTMHVWLAKQEDLSDAEHVGEAELNTNDGCTGVVPLTKLKANTQYQYAVSLRKVKPARKHFHSFTTFPKPSARRSFSFLFGSCYLPLDDHGSQTFDEINAHVESDDLRFGLLLGDQIYADIAERNGIGKIATTLDEYRSVYAYAWSRPSFKNLAPNLPLFMILDDHEIEDDWRFDAPERTHASMPLFNQVLRLTKGTRAEGRQLSMDRIRAALKAYQEHQAMHAPKMLIPFQKDQVGGFMFQHGEEGSFAYTFNYGGAAFFIMDTRTMRVKKGKNILLGDAQWRMLEDWLLNVKDKYPVKFLVTSGTILYPFLLDVSLDRWSGFRSERERLFQFLAENEIEGIRILTGDLHSAHAVSAEIKCPSGKHIPIWEFCSTPFEQESMWISATYFPVISKWLRKQKKLFRQTGNNFGIVHVDFDEPAPQVSFTLHYNQDGGWKSQPPINT